jgi:dTDP-4-amino-4,6-dideoxygalactose transaminase
MTTIATKLKLPTWPVIAADEINAVSEVLSSGKINYWTGTQGRSFESEFAAYVGCKYGIALANGTLGLELALKAIGIQAGDEVIVPAKTFIATASAVVACQAVPVVADVDLQSQNLSLSTIKPMLSSKTRAIIVVHVGGLCCDMDPIMDFAKKNNIYVIEDCAQAHGAKYKGKYAGNLADMSVFSFCQDKIMTTGGEGGMLLTDNEEIWRSAWEYKDHGKDYAMVHDPNLNLNNYNFKWLHNSFGSNYRLSEMQAAIGRLQLPKLQTWVDMRRRNAQLLLSGIKEINGLEAFVPGSDYVHSYYRFYFFLKPERLNSAWSKSKLLVALNNMGIPCNEGVCSEIYLEKAFTKNNLGPESRFANAQRLSDTTLALLVHPTLEPTHIQAILDGLRQVMETATA